MADAPTNLRIALGSRVRLPIPLARFRAMGRVVEIGPDDLCFTRGELAAVLADARLDESALDTVHSRTGGWPAATQLLGDAWARQPCTDGRGAPFGPSAFDTFLEQEVLPRLDAADVDLLARLSVLDEIDYESCQAVIAEPKPFERLEALAERFACVTEVDLDGVPTYRIHALLREFLLRRLPDPERRISLTRAADFFEQHDRPIEAGQAAIALGDTERLAALIRREAMRLMAQSRARTLVRWLDTLPPDAFDADPGLLARRAHVEGELGNLAHAQALFERAATRLLEQGELAAAADVLRVQAGQLEVAGAFVEARAVLGRAIDIVADDRGSMLGVMLRNQLSVIRLRDGDPDGAVALAHEVVALTEELNDARARPLLLAVAHANLANVLLTLGRFREAEDAFRASIALKRQFGYESSLANTLNNLGVLYQQQGRRAEAHDTLSEALTLATQHGVAVVRAYALSNLGDVARDLGDFLKAEAHYEQSLAEKARLGSDFGTAHTLNCLAALRRLQGDLKSARELNDGALSLRDSSAGPIEHLMYRLERGRIDLAAGQLAEACADLHETAAELERFGARHHALHATWWAAVARWRVDGSIDIESSALSREELVPLIAESPDFALAAWSAGRENEALADALVHHHELVLPRIASTELSAALVRLLPRLPGNAPLQLLVDALRSPSPGVRTAAGARLDSLRAIPAPPLSVSAYGGLRVQRRGALIPERAWRRQRSLELLALLLMAGPKGRSRDELIAECWPEAAPEAGIEQFHTHLHALRSALEPEAARGTSRYVLADGRTYRLDFGLVQQWDVAHLAAASEAGHVAESAGDMLGAAGRYAAASERYAGELFAGMLSEGEWLERAREDHRQRVTDVRARLARVRERVGDPLGAREAWALVLALDPLREDAHRGIMSVLVGIGERDAALAQFRACADVLRRELGVGPSRETTALYRDIARV